MGQVFESKLTACNTNDSSKICSGYCDTINLPLPAQLNCKADMEANTAPTTDIESTTPYSLQTSDTGQSCHEPSLITSTCSSCDTKTISIHDQQIPLARDYHSTNRLG